MGMIADLLSQQQQWQQRQSESEQLIARMAEKLEQSQKSIETLTGMLSETSPEHHLIQSDLEDANSAPELAGSDSHPEVVANDPAPVNSEPDMMSWEKQKRMLMADLGEEVPPLCEPESHAARPAEPNCSSIPAEIPDDSEVATPEVVSPEPAPKNSGERSGTFQAASDDELEALGDADKAEMIRRLRTMLEEKLRDAEIEISIERARIHRAKRELEQQRTEFEREVTRMKDEEKLTAKGKKGRQSRWARFLGENNESE